MHVNYHHVNKQAIVQRDQSSWRKTWLEHRAWCSYVVTDIFLFDTFFDTSAAKISPAAPWKSKIRLCSPNLEINSFYFFRNLQFPEIAIFKSAEYLVNLRYDDSYPLKRVCSLCGGDPDRETLFLFVFCSIPLSFIDLCLGAFISLSNRGDSASSSVLFHHKVQPNLNMTNDFPKKWGGGNLFSENFRPRKPISYSILIFYCRNIGGV